MYNYMNSYYYGFGGYGFGRGRGFGRGKGRGRGRGSGRGRGFGYGATLGYCPWTGLPRGWRWMNTGYYPANYFTPYQNFGFPVPFQQNPVNNPVNEEVKK